MASDIGHMLRDARHSRGITLSEAARHTGVRETHLAALERGELEAYGVDAVYVRGILRAYADYLELDSQSLAARYRSQAADDLAPTSAPAGVGTASRALSSGRSRRLLPRVAGVLLVVAVVAGAAVATLRWRSSDQTSVAGSGEQTAVEDTGSERPASAVTAVAEEPSEEQTDLLLAIPQSTEGPDELTMKLEFTDKVWVRVLVDGRNKLEGIMRPGAVTQFTGKRRIELRLGVAEAVEFSLNGAWYGNIAQEHNGPVNVTCTPDKSCRVTEIG